MPAVDRPLHARAQLDEASNRIARGIELRSATSDSGYKATTSASIHFYTSQGDDGIAKILVRRFCDIVVDASLLEIGVYQHGNEIWMVLAAPFAPPAPDDAAEVRRRVLDLVNEARAHARKCGRKKFSATTSVNAAAALDRAALNHAKDMAGRSYLGHDGSDGSNPAARATRAGYKWASIAENVASGQMSAEQVVATWLASPGHCTNLMNPRYSAMGVAYVVAAATEQGIYWAQVFAAPR